MRMERHEKREVGKVVRRLRRVACGSLVFVGYGRLRVCCAAVACGSALVARIGAGWLRGCMVARAYTRARVRTHGAPSLSSTAVL